MKYEGLSGLFFKPEAWQVVSGSELLIFREDAFNYRFQAPEREFDNQTRWGFIS